MLGGLVIVDTDVWSYLFSGARRVDPRIAGWHKLLRGRSVAIAVQTRAEVLTGILQRRLGESATAAITAQLDLTPTIPVDEGVIRAYAMAGAGARAIGHPLAQKGHTGDRWIAATAIAAGAPLLSGDRLYRGAPGLTLLHEYEGQELD